jgi:serine/threonine-protein kinase RsbT
MSSELEISKEHDVNRAVLETVAFSRKIGFSETPSRMVATAVSELARNILKYAGSGKIRMRQVEGRSGHGIEIDAIDEGPGIENATEAMRDHFSSSGTLGLGLPGVERMMDEFSLDSTPGVGTRVTVRKWI